MNYSELKKINTTTPHSHPDSIWMVAERASYKFYSIDVVALAFSITSSVSYNISLWSCGGVSLKAKKKDKKKQNQKFL